MAEQIPPLPDKPLLPFRLTRAGLIYLALGAFVCIAAVNSGVNLLYFVFGMTVGLFLVSILLSWWSLKGLKLQREFGEHVVAGEPTDIEYQLSNTKRFWPAMALYLRETHAEIGEAPRGFVLYLPPQSRRVLPERVRFSTRLVPLRRGILKLSTVEISTTFPFGFLRCTRRLEFPQEMIVYPRIGMLNRHLALQYRESIESGTMTSNRRGGNDEFYGVREYRPGDNIRAIHWRSSARTGELMIRELAANAPPQLIIVLNLRTWRKNPEGLPAVERAIELAAALLCYGFYENFAVALAVAGVPGQRPPAPQMGRDARARLLRQLAVIDPEQIGEGGGGIEFPNRLAGRAEWVIITLQGADPTRHLLPPGAAAHSATAAGGGSGHRTVLPLDAPDAGTWIHFLSANDALRLLRDRGAA